MAVLGRSRSGAPPFSNPGSASDPSLSMTYAHGTVEAEEEQGT